jgi:glycosyltransferase involved in cell wall biosynthesis
MYKVAAYVTRCIESLENQDIDKNDYEIICINDGSPDNCKELVEGLQENYTNIVLINQENQGVSMARNNGIARAKGDYLLMVDPDDYIETNRLMEILDFLYLKRLDVGIAEFQIINEQYLSTYKYSNGIDLAEPISGIEYFNQFFKGKTELKLPDRSWGIFFLREFIVKNDLLYLKGMPYLEDGELLYRIYTLAQRVYFIKGPFYNLTTRVDSATAGNLFYSEKAKIGFLNAAENLKAFQNKFEKKSVEFQFLNQPISKFLFLYLRSSSTIFFLKELFKNREIKQKFPRLMIENSNAFYSKFSKHYNNSLLDFYFNYFVYDLKQRIIKIIK